MQFDDIADPDFVSSPEFTPGTPEFDQVMSNMSPEQRQAYQDQYDRLPAAVRERLER
ncbi:hypothetical protein ACQP2Y_21275 [Actinoplanes sp. CA-051413]|uniref:hypothetical protein n=1 Tax=Actinoplanes sp. CA-051413 TaxID=3239899 RepID=UPI003D9851CF